MSAGKIVGKPLGTAFDTVGSRRSMREMGYSEVRQLVYDTAVEFAKRGSGWAQERPVLHEVGKRLDSRGSSQTQELILTCWHDLFHMGKLSWGFNLDNPNAPFFHIPRPDAEREKELARAGRN